MWVLLDVLEGVLDGCLFGGMKGLGKKRLSLHCAAHQQRDGEFTTWTLLGLRSLLEDSRRAHICQHLGELFDKQKLLALGANHSRA